MSTGVYRTTSWALIDQAIVSGGNFLTNLVLIRTLVPSAYGAYALVLNAMLFLNNLHTNMIAYPVCMAGARADDQQLRGITTGDLLVTLMASRNQCSALITITCFFWLISESLNSCCYRSRPALAAPGDPADRIRFPAGLQARAPRRRRELPGTGRSGGNNLLASRA